MPAPRRFRSGSRDDRVSLATPTKLLGSLFKTNRTTLLHRLAAASSLPCRTSLWPLGFGLFAPPVRGTLQFSLTLLVRYRSQVVFRVRGSCPRSSRAISNARYSGYHQSPTHLPLRGCHPLGRRVPADFAFMRLGVRWSSLHISAPFRGGFGLPCAPFDRLYSAHLV